MGKRVAILVMVMSTCLALANRATTAVAQSQDEKMQSQDQKMSGDKDKMGTDKMGKKKSKKHKKDKMDKMDDKGKMDEQNK